ncbi:activation-associated secreted protein-1 [Aphelenchoides avenae]|nr:activation-associated secreted protein-1 [Aphelenchus avenae]
MGYATATCKFGDCECQYTAELSDEHRRLVVDKQNGFRSQLALGQAVNKDGKTLPSAANIIKLKYSATLEWYARRWASKCQPKFRFKDVDNILGNIYFHQAGKLERGKYTSIRLYNGTGAEL